jgi:hypothetical protein
MTERDLSAIADANYYDTFRRIVATMDGGEAVQGDGLLLVRSGLPVAMFNIAFVTRPLRDPRASIERAIAYFDGHKLPFVVRLREGVDDAAEHAAEACGLPYTDTVPGMIMAPIVSGPATPGGLEVRAARDPSVLADHRTVIAASFGMPVEMVEQFVHDRVIDVPECEFYVGYLASVPFASSMLWITDGTAGVWNVGCVPAQRKRGLGEAMTWHAVRRGGELGCSVANLQASEMGRPIYERMGFRLVSLYRTFARKS